MLSTCRNRAKGCYELAEQGMCVSSPVHMLEACRLSCGLCTTTCRDMLPGCADRAEQCRSNSPWMARSCPVTCGVCSTSEPTTRSATECDAAAGGLPPGWFRLRSGHYRHEFFADAPPGASVDVNRSLGHASVEWSLPSGWRWRPNEPAAPFASDYFGEASASWPVTYQNEARFGPYYRRLSRRVAADARALLARRDGSAATAPRVRSSDDNGDSSARDLLETALRILRGPELLRDSGEIPAAQMAEAAAASADAVRAYAGTGRARVLFLVGHPWDWFLHHAAYQLPAWLVEGATALLHGDEAVASGEPCGTWGWERRPLVSLPAAAASGGGELDSDGAAAAEATVEPEPSDAAHARVAADVAIAAFVQHHWRGAIEVEVVDVCTHPEKLDPDYFDRFDVVHGGMFGSYDMATAASNADRLRAWATGRAAVRTGVASALGAALRATTRAVVWPPPRLDFNANKSRLPLLLRAAGVPAAPAFDVPLEPSPPLGGSSKEARAAAAEADGLMAEQVLARAAAAGWEAAFVKPHGSSFMNGVDKLEADETTAAGGAAAVREATSRLRGLIGSLRTRGAPGLVTMRHLPSVATSWELRLFFARGECVWAVGNRVDAVQFAHTERREGDYHFAWDFMDRDGGGINSGAVRFDDVLVPLAKTALEAAAAEGAREGALVSAPSRAGGEAPPVARVDVACCLAADDPLATAAAGWFVNEIEWAPDSMMTHFLHHLATTVEQQPRWQDDERLRTMVPRAAAAWYPMPERMATELARFAIETAERSRRSDQVQAS